MIQKWIQQIKKRSTTQCITGQYHPPKPIPRDHHTRACHTTSHHNTKPQHTTSHHATAHHTVPYHNTNTKPWYGVLSRSNVDMSRLRPIACVLFKVLRPAACECVYVRVNVRVCVRVNVRINVRVPVCAWVLRVSIVSASLPVCCSRYWDLQACECVWMDICLGHNN